MLRAAIYERHWHPPCIVRRSSSLSVVHAHVRDNHRLVAIKTAFARLAKPGELQGSLKGGAKPLNCTVSNLLMPNLLNANSAEPPSMMIISSISS